ncbi:hypothetical protein [Thiomicrorhabdus chilensis]|uniref:hypothetical protein n=1 Tax=Thiomicrorhabdus chilensis TaxID=63656 RepID=UPI0004074AB2|nr:hypothetical protein [Thiomicrorhabdus chilensis]
MKELGGYFELELNQGEPYHKNALALNSARNCFKYILKAKQPPKVYIPAYCCDSLIESLQAENIDYAFYHINEQFELLDLPQLKPNEKLLYINYFALKSEYVRNLHSQYGEALIVDNTQAFFEMPIQGVDTFYSPRKFFGVADGGYLYTDRLLEQDLEQDHSASRFTQLLGRYENTASEFYNHYQTSENALINQPIKWMSKLTQGILKSLDYNKIALTRQRNFWALEAFLGEKNQFKGICLTDFVPMVYPYLTDDLKLRSRLIENKIYIAKYWMDAIERVNEQEKHMIENVVYLPIDQRIKFNGLNKIKKVVQNEAI